MVIIVHHRSKVYVVHLNILSVFLLAYCFVFAYLYRSHVCISIYATCCGIVVILIAIIFLYSYTSIFLYKYYNHTFVVIAENQAG